MAESNKCVVAIRTPSGNLVKAFDVRISGHDVYVIYSDCSVRDAHSSYHASGQYHIKIGKRYVQWDGGPTATMEPMKLFSHSSGANHRTCRMLDGRLGNLQARRRSPTAR